MHRLDCMPQRRSGLDDSRQPDDAALDRLVTEAGSQPGADYDLRATLELVELMNAEDATVPAAVAAAAPSIAAAVDAISDCLARGGRLDLRRRGIVGKDRGARRVGMRVHLLRPAGNRRLARRRWRERATSRTGGGRGRSGGREPRTSPPSRLATTTSSSASARVEGRPTCSARSKQPARAGARTACVVSAQASELEALVDHPVVVVVGPEFLAGSTRLKAGTAQKLVLNTLSTVSMIRLGKTFGNLMVDVSATNEKLRARVRRIVGPGDRRLTGAGRARALGGGRRRQGRHRLPSRRDRFGRGPGEARRRRAEHPTRRCAHEAGSRSRPGRRPASSGATSSWPTGVSRATACRLRTGMASPFRASSISR